jgi:hypothetical protein
VVEPAFVDTAQVVLRPALAHDAEPDGAVDEIVVCELERFVAVPGSSHPEGCDESVAAAGVELDGFPDHLLRLVVSVQPDRVRLFADAVEAAGREDLTDGAASDRDPGRALVGGDERDDLAAAE